MSNLAGTHYTGEPDGRSTIVKVVMPFTGSPGVFEVYPEHSGTPELIWFYGVVRALRIEGVWYEYGTRRIARITEPAKIRALEDLEVVQ